MKSRTAHDFFRSRIGSGALVGAAISVVLSTPAWSADFEKGDFSLSWDTTLAYGLNLRLDDPDPRIIGLANGGAAFSVNGDDGNLNYDTGVVNALFKISSEIELRYRNFGAFVRGRAFYDIEQEDGERERTPLSEEAFGQANGQTFRDASGIILNRKAVVQRLTRGRKKAERKLREHEGCRDLFVALGSNGLNELAETTYHWVTRQEDRRLCARTNASAFTSVNATRTCLCPDFTRLDSYQVAVALIHEALHHAGLPEMPPDPLAMTSAEINTLVKRHCRL